MHVIRAVEALVLGGEHSPGRTARRAVRPEGPYRPGQSGDPDAADVPISSASDTSLEVHENQGETDSGAEVFEKYENAFIAADPSTGNNPLKSGESSQLISSRPLQEIPKQGEHNSVSFNVSQYNKIGSNLNNPNELYARDWLLYSVSTTAPDLAKFFPGQDQSGALADFIKYTCYFYKAIYLRAPCGALRNLAPWAIAPVPPQLRGLLNKQLVLLLLLEFRIHRQSRGIKGHEESQMHFQALICWRQSEKASRSSISLEKLATAEMQKGIHHYKQVLLCIVDAILYLAKNILAFRGSSSQIQDDDAGNFLSLIELLSKYSPALAIHVNNLSKN
ncbi:Zinc finger MYM-type protein 1 [Folsomia candida]|uniref:Zinc finger MYM-type protein 1 n=1 Tax=Folsomia candida TaxID=158441 RepID=A0A226EE54_FOLCA|nr:Zinc finger MYM-type protein 1 [Folsomia candida]